MSQLQILFLLLLHTTSLYSQSSDQSGQRTECFNDIYMVCDEQRWTDATSDEYDECISSHNGYLTYYSVPPGRSDCTGGVPCSHCVAVELTACECSCYDDCDDAYITVMRILGAFLTIIACLIAIFWALSRNNKKKISDKDIKENMDDLINLSVTVNYENDRPYIGKITEVKTDENDEVLFNIEFTMNIDKDKENEWIKKDIITIHGNKEKDGETTCTWQEALAFLICLVCTIFAIIFYYDPLAFYPEENGASQEEKLGDWGIGFVVFGSIGACCFCICLCLTFFQRKMDREYEEKKAKDSNDIEMNAVTQTDDKETEEKEEDEREGHVPVRVWIVRTIAFGVCGTILLVIGSIMIGNPNALV